MRTIALSFVFKGLSDEQFEKLSAHVKELATEQPVILIHGHMPRKVVEQKGFDTKLCDLLDECFPIQLNLWHEKTLREEMATIAEVLDAEVFVIGEVKDGVAEEVALYAEANCIIKYIEL